MGDRTAFSVLPFAKYRLQGFSRLVHYSPGIKGVVHFGGKCPAVPDEAIEALRTIYGHEIVHVIDTTPQPGDSVEIAGGAFHGLKAVVTRVMPARERVGVLLDFLGRQTMVEVSLRQVVRESISLSPLLHQRKTCSQECITAHYGQTCVRVW